MSNVYIRVVAGCVGLVLATLVLADVGGAESNRENKKASSEWEDAKNAVRDGDKKLLRSILQSEEGFVNKFDGLFSLLGIAASKGDYEIVKMLVNSGGDPDVGNGDALYSALSGEGKGYVKEDIKDRLEIALYLVKNGASFNHMMPGYTAEASIIESYIMILCDSDGYPEYATTFLEEHGFNYPVLPEFRSNYVHIANLTEGDMEYIGKNRECVDFMFRATGGESVESYLK